MILSDKRIKEGIENGDIIISDFDKARINPASYDVLLGDEIAMYLPKMDIEKMRRSHIESEPDWIPDSIPWEITNKLLQKSNTVTEFLDNIREESFEVFYEFIHNIQEDIIIDPLNKPEVYKFKIPNEGFRVKPNFFYLYTTKEVIGSKIYASEIKNKSSLARLGILPHMVSSWIDPGFVGNITLEVACWIPVILRADMKIGQLIFHETTEVEQTYDKKPGSKYMNQSGVQESKYQENYK